MAAKGGKGGAARKAPRGAGMAGGRPLAVRVRAEKGRTASQMRWLERQLNDPYVAAARRRGYRSRAAFKLAELDDRLHLLRPARRIVELGAAPGGWTQVALERRPTDRQRARKLVAVDLLEMAPLAGAEILRLDFLAEDAPGIIRAALGGPADLVLSDMAPPATGHGGTDHLRIMALAEAAAEFAMAALAPGGALVVKVLQGGAEPALLARLKQAFAKVRHVKPPASRAELAELYLVATGFRPR